MGQLKLINLILQFNTIKKTASPAILVKGRVGAGGADPAPQGQGNQGVSPKKDTIFVKSSSDTHISV